MARLFLIDGSNQMYRAYHAIRGLTGPDGKSTNAVYGFTTMLKKLIADHNPEYIAASFDLKGPTFRSDLAADYKANRSPMPPDLAEQIPWVHEACEALGVFILTSERFEADDVIGTLTERHRGVMPVDIVTGDRDLLQLVDDAHGIRVLYTGKGGVREPDVATQSYLLERYAVPTGDAYADMSILRGDTSDGLPGVKGIGDKTAAQLIATYGSLEGLRAAVAAGDPSLRGARRTNLEAAAAYLDVAPTVVRVARDAPVADVDLALPRAVADPERLDRLATEYAVTNPVTRLLTALALA